MIWGGVCMFVEPSAQSMPALPLVILTALLQQLLRIRKKNICFSATWSLVFLGTMPKSAIELGWPGSPLFSSQCQKDLHHRCPGSYFSPPGMQGAARAGICPLFLQSCTMDAVPWTQYGSQGPGQKAAVCSGANTWKAPTWASVLAGWSTWGNTVGGVRNVTIEIFALVKCSQDWKLLDLIPVNLSEPHSLYCSAQPGTRRQEPSVTSAQIQQRYMMGWDSAAPDITAESPSFLSHNWDTAFGHLILTTWSRFTGEQMKLLPQTSNPQSSHMWCCTTLWTCPCFLLKKTKRNWLVCVNAKESEKEMT